MRPVLISAVALSLASVFGLTAFGALDAFENADFENAAKYGRHDRYTEVGRGFGRNGNGGARVSGFARHCLALPVKPDLKLKKGERYVFALDTKNGSGEILEQIAFEVYNRKTGKYDHGYWGRKSVDIGAGWQREELTFVPKRDLDAAADDLRFILFVQLDPTKNAKPSAELFVDCDNAILKTDDPLWYFCNTWPTHNKVFNEEGRVRACSFFVGPFLPEDAKPVYTLSLKRPDGTPLAERTAEEDNGVLFASFGRIDYEGPAKLVCTLADRGKTWTRSRDVTVAPTYVPKPGEVFINERGQALVDGKPFMPLGFYTSFDPAKMSREEIEGHLKKIGEAGFNFLIDYSTYKLVREEDRDFFYGACAKYGLRVLADDFAGYQQTPDKIPEIAAKAGELARYPAVIGWYTMDESSEDKVPVLDRIRRALNEATPGHVVLTCNIMEPAPYLPTADVQGGDIYPIDAGEGRCLRGGESYMRKAGACRPAAGWHAPQWLNWANYRRGALESKEAYDKAGREPQENEMLAVALAYAANGMTGFTFYSYFDMFRGPYPERVEARWQNMVKVGKALKDLEPFITSGEKRLEIAVTNVKGESRVVALTDGKGDVRVLVFGLDCENECTFTLPATVGTPVPTCGFVKIEDGRYRYAGREFTCDVLKGDGKNRQPPSKFGKLLGYQLDISRCKVPKMDALYRIVDILERLGYNQFQLYTEHAFAYSQHRVVWEEASPMTAAEIRALDDYCARRGIELVPNQNSFGHLENWLRHPEYNILAEAPRGGTTYKKWDDYVLAQPSCLNPTDPRSVDFLAGLYDELFPCFRSKFVNVGCDETMELLDDHEPRLGRSAAEVAAKGPHKVYVEFLNRIHELCAERGRRMMFWGDIVLQHPECLPDLPKDVVCLNWGYEADHPFEKQTAALQDSGLDFVVCPGTSAWGSLSGRTDNMMGNIDNAVAAAQRHGAMGFLLADWGDGGHPNPWIVSLPGIVYLAQVRRGEKLSREQLEGKLDALLGCRCGKALLTYGDIYRKVGGRMGNATELYYLLREGRDYERKPGVTDESLGRALSCWRTAKSFLDLTGAPDWVKDDFEMLDLLYRAVELRIESPDVKNFRATFEPEYRRLWRKQNRVGGLAESVSRIFGR